MCVQALREQVQEEGKENKGVELQAREEVATAVVELLRAFPHPSTFPWREVFVTGKSETEVMRDMAVLFGDSAIIQALGDPGSVLQCECCQRTAHADEQDEGAVIGSMPDICIAYQLLCEYQVHRISLRDWLYQFDEALRSSGSTKAASKSEALEEPSATVQARFSQAVAELELLGIIVPAARPPDHMERIY
ncbi:unnamed protein product [Notodromas monacha]|uniref:Origin recognition complex subunit 3 winged helix C-terminal domain-containing protein n=1 Tax=Notodromas monacha TaxID=399045 RepID=A0A7R9G997_9CRUS|nr:unnamed protein product [Notodromas monacha]CAG0912950.1 unnamed protein product [Notodromas monacha]